ncbi:MAG: enoyl-CoA hydratase [Defluviicoccus sp.]|nr:enoyl-CoA hydratase [Defluviicoccus sp.]
MSAIHVEFADNPGGGRVATVCHDNADKLNVVDRDATEALGRAIRQAGESLGVRAVVLRGAGERAFIGGADISEMVDLTPETARPFIGALHDACMAIRTAPVPVVARLAGYCLGAGLEIAASCDLRVADATAKLGMPEVRVGIPSVIEAALLPRLVGWGRAARLVYTGETIGAERAESWGLVDSLVPEGELDDGIARTVNTICRAGPTAIRLQKALLRDWEELPLAEAIERSMDALAEGFASGEARERMRAFLDRRR